MPAGTGPYHVVTNLATLDFHPESKRMRLIGLNPGVTKEQVIEETGFALLFLTRAADLPRAFIPPDQPLGPITRDDRPPEEAALPPRLPVGDVKDWLEWGLPLSELTRACLLLGPRSLLDLVEALRSPDAKVRQRANEGLRALLGDERVGRADAHPLARGRLRLWIRGNERFLEARNGRFRIP